MEILVVTTVVDPAVVMLFADAASVLDVEFGPKEKYLMGCGDDDDDDDDDDGGDGGGDGGDGDDDDDDDDEC